MVLKVAKVIKDILNLLQSLELNFIKKKEEKRLSFAKSRHGIRGLEGKS